MRTDGARKGTATEPARQRRRQRVGKGMGNTRKACVCGFGCRFCKSCDFTKYLAAAEAVRQRCTYDVGNDGGSVEHTPQPARVHVSAERNATLALVPAASWCKHCRGLRSKPVLPDPGLACQCSGFGMLTYTLSPRHGPCILQTKQTCVQRTRAN